MSYRHAPQPYLEDPFSSNGLSPLDFNNALKGCRISDHRFPPHMRAFDWHTCTSSSFTCCISCVLLPDLLCCLLCVVACFVLLPALLCCNKPCPRKAGGSISSASDGVIHLTWGHLLDSYHEETSEVPLGSLTATHREPLRSRVSRVVWTPSRNPIVPYGITNHIIGLWSHHRDSCFSPGLFHEVIVLICD